MGRQDWMVRGHRALYNQSKQTDNYMMKDVPARIGIIAGPNLTWYNTVFHPNLIRFHGAFDRWQNPAEHTPLMLSFSGDERGKTFYFAMHRENTRGEKCPWNEIQSIVIP
jgi:hypothetical protein